MINIAQRGVQALVRSTIGTEAASWVQGPGEAPEREAGEDQPETGYVTASTIQRKLARGHTRTPKLPDPEGPIGGGSTRAIARCGLSEQRLGGCTAEQVAGPVCEASTDMTTTPTGNSAAPWLARCHANSNRQATCTEARAEACDAPIPVTRDHPLYQYMNDADGDRQVCD